MGVRKSLEFDPVMQTGNGLWRLTQTFTGVFLLLGAVQTIHSTKKSEVELPWPKSVDSKFPMIYPNNHEILPPSLLYGLSDDITEIVFY